MSRLTLDLPESLHRQLSAQAEKEGVSLSQFLLYSLTRLISMADLAAQHQGFVELVSRYPRDEAEQALAELLADRQPA